MKDLSLAAGIGSDVNFLNGNLVDGNTEIGEHVNQDIVQFFQKLMNLSNLTPNGNFDNEINGYQLIDALRRTLQKKYYFPTNVFNSTPIALDATKIITVDDGDGSTVEITGDVTNYTLSTVFVDPTFAKGARVFLYISGSQDITIENTSSPSAAKIRTPFDANVIVKAGSVIELYSHVSNGWSIISSTIPLIKASGEIFTKVVDIGDWNMASTASLQVAHGLTYANIRHVDVLIRNDADDQRNSLNIYDNTGGVGVNGGAIYVDSTNIRLYRASSVNGGMYDNTSYDSTSYNRGWIFITYTN